MAVLKKSALLDLLVQSYNIPSSRPTIRKSHEPPLPHTILYLIFCKGVGQVIHQTCSAANLQEY
jgi:hypothetical protein